MAFLEVKGLCKSFSGTQVLKGISFSMEKGEVLALIGSSGGGKTTLLRCLNRLEFADEGTISLNGEMLYDAKDLKNREKRISKKENPGLQNKWLHFGLVFQNYNLFPQYTALENLMLAPQLNHASSKADIAAEAKKFLSMVGLEDKANHYPHQLSGGQQQRTAIARALMMQPDILCFDEPTSALDPELTAEVMNVIRMLKNQGHTMIVVTHEMSFVRAATDRVLFISDGIIEEEGTPSQVLDHPKSIKTKSFMGYEGKA